MSLRRRVLQSGSTGALCRSVSKLPSANGENEATKSTSSLPKITVDHSFQTDVLKSIADLEEYLEDVYPNCLNANHRGDTDNSKDVHFWVDIRKQMLEIAELTCQTYQFDKCCHGDSDCPFASSIPSRPHRIVNSNRLRRRGSSPVASSNHLRQREVLVSYGGFESIVNNNNHDSDFETEEEYDPQVSKNEVIFRRDLNAPLRIKKHQSYPSSRENSQHPLLKIQSLPGQAEKYN